MAGSFSRLGGACRTSRIAGLIAVGAAVAAAHANGLRGDLVLDARPLILENPALRAATLANVRTLVSTPYWHPLANDGLYRPLTTLSYFLNYAVLGNAGRPFGYHVVNLVLHLVCVALVYALVRATVGRTLPALLAAALFGLHPVTTEAVANVVGRADVLAALGVVGGLLCHVGAMRADGRRRIAWRAGLAGAAVVAAFSKESGLLLLPVLLLYDGLLGDRRGTRAPDYVVVALVAGAYLAARAAVAIHAPLPDEPSPMDNPIVEAPFAAGRATAVKALGTELALLVWPATLSADYSFAEIPVVRLPPESWDDWQAAVALVAIAGVLVAALRVRRRRAALAFFVLFLVLTLLPTANLAVVIGAIMAERFLYLPLVGFAGAVGVALGPVLARRRVVPAVVVCAALLALALRTAARNRDWRDDPTLAARTVEAAPRSAKAHRGWAATLFEAGPARIDEVVAEAERAVAIRPDYLQALIDLGRYEVVAGELASRRGADGAAWYERAASALQRASVIDEALNRRFAERMKATGRDRDGIPEIGHLELYEALAIASVRLGRREDAVAALEHARALSPLDPHWYVELATQLQELGRSDDAAITLLEALAVRSTDAETGGRLAELYRASGADGAVIEDGNRLTIDLDQPTVRRHRCEAYRRLEAVFVRANLRAEAANAGKVAAEVCGDR